MSRALMIFAHATMIALSLACSAQSPNNIHSAPNIEAQKLYDRYDQSWGNHDLNQVLSFHDPSFTAVDAKGKRVGFADYRKQVTDTFGNPKLRNFNKKTTIKDVQLQAGRMVTYNQVELRLQYQDQNAGWEPIIITSSLEETWQRKGSEWKLVASHVFRVNTTLDPQWAAMRQQQLLNSMKAVDRASSVLVPCNYSYTGCR